MANSLLGILTSMFSYTMTHSHVPHDVYDDLRHALDLYGICGADQ